MKENKSVQALVKLQQKLTLAKQNPFSEHNMAMDRLKALDSTRPVEKKSLGGIVISDINGRNLG